MNRQLKKFIKNNIRLKEILYVKEVDLENKIITFDIKKVPKKTHKEGECSFYSEQVKINHKKVFDSLFE